MVQTHYFAVSLARSHIFTTLILVTLSSAISANPAKPSPTSTCQEATLCVDGLQTCTSGTTTQFVRWGDCYNTCTTTLSRPPCPTPFTDATDPTATPSDESSTQSTKNNTPHPPALTPTIASTLATATSLPSIPFTKGVGGSVFPGVGNGNGNGSGKHNGNSNGNGKAQGTRTKDVEDAKETGTVRVPATAWKKVEERAKQWFGRGVLHLIRDGFRGAGL